MSTTKPKSKRPPRVLANRYEVVRKLGKGNFGTAFLCKDLRHKTEEGFELKVLKEIGVGDLQPDETVEAAREARVLSKLNHPSIVKFHDSFIDGEVFCIVTEYCEGGDLDARINDYKKSRKQFDERTVMDWFVQLLLAVHYMHTRRVLHRDLKTRNIFLRKNKIKIGDFGISRILMGTTDMASTFTGTPYYMSPEVLKHEGYNSKSDVWSIGCIVYELCTLEHAFGGQSLMGVMYKIVEGEVPKLPDRFSSELNRLFQLMLQKDPAKRPSATELLKEKLIANHIQKMSSEYQMKSNDSSQNDAYEIANMMKEKSYLRDLRLEEEDVKYRNLPPRERMRLRKQAEADKEAQRLKELAKVNLKANFERKTKIKESLNKTTVPAWAGGEGEGIGIKDALMSPKEPESPDPYNQYSQYSPADYNHHFASKTAPVVHTSLAEEEDIETLKYKSMSSAQLGKSLKDYTVNPDERPITPLRDKMVYDPLHSSLDFKDGIPENEELANTYYSQYEDFSDDEDEEDENAKTVINRESEMPLHENDNQGTLVDKKQLSVLSQSRDATLISHSNEEDQFYNCLQEVLDQGDDAESTMNLADSKEDGAFGPVAKETKIKNLRAECERTLGKEAFEKAYSFIKEARDSGMKEEEIMQGLRKYVKNPSDCFLVDQLLFLEEF